MTDKRGSVVPLVYEDDRLYVGAISGPGSFAPARAANAFLLEIPGAMSVRDFEARLALGMTQPSRGETRHFSPARPSVVPSGS